MKTENERSFIQDHPDDQNLKLEKLKMDLYNMRDNLEMMEMLLKSNQADRIKAYLPELKRTIFELEYHSLTTE